MHLTHIVPSFAPPYARHEPFIRARAAALSQIGHSVEVLSTADSPPSPEALESLTLESFPRNWPRFIDTSKALAERLAASPSDIVHHYGLWSRTLHYAHTAAQKRSAPLVISPLGMTSPRSWQHNAFKKNLARRYVHPGALKAAAGWVVANKSEADDIAALGFNQPVCVDRGGVAAPEPDAMAAAAAHWRKICPQLVDHRVALFHSGFHERKRIIELIDLWLERAPRDWTLLVVGEPQSYSTAMLQRYVLRNSGTGRVRIYDSFGHPPPYAVASIFLQPSHHESFGRNIADAMAYGLPTVVTDTTPWHGLNETGGGWCVPWSEFGPILTGLTTESRQKLRARGMLARAWVLREFSWENSARALADFYTSLATPAI